MTNFVITDFLYIIYGPLDGAKVKIIGPALGSLLLIIIASGLVEIFLFVHKPKLEQEKKLAGILFKDSGYLVGLLSGVWTLYS